VERERSAAAAMLGLPGFVVLAVSDYAGELEQAIETTADVVGCPECGAVADLQDAQDLTTAVPHDLDLHLVLDNYATHKTPKVKDWLLRHPRFHLHFTPTSSSWLTWSNAGLPS
jgi:hypothetical protein